MITVYYKSARHSKILEVDKPREGAWIHVESPDDQELEKLAADFGLDIDLLHDGIDPNELPRIEHEDGKVYIFTRYCLPESERLTTAPLLIIYGEKEVITLSSRPFDSVHELVHGNTIIFTSKRAQLVLQILNAVSAGFKGRINRVGRRILQIRTQLNKLSIDNRDFIGFIDTEEDLNDFLLVLEPMDSVLAILLNGRFMKLYDEDKDLIEDLQLGNKELVQLTRSRLTSIRNIRDAYQMIASNDLNRIFKILTGITILLSVFNIVTGFYGMNIALPAQHSHYAFWMVLGLITLGISSLVLIFKRNNLL